MRNGSLESLLWDLLDGTSADLLRIAGWVAVLAALIAVLVWAVVRVRNWFRDDDGTAVTDESMLLQLGDLHRQGDLSDEEYRSIKGELVQRMESGGEGDRRS